MSIFVQRTIHDRHKELAKTLCNERVTEQLKAELVKLVPNSKKIWKDAIQQLRRDGRKLKLPYKFRSDPKTYALDGLIIARALGIPDERSSLPLQIFCLFYLSVHIIDDLVEDHAKFRSHFTVADKRRSSQGETVKEVLPFSYTLNVLLSIYRMLMENSCYAKNSDEIFSSIATSLGSFTHFFLLERKELPPRKIFQIKERGVSGVATSMIADILCLKDIFSHKIATNLKQALYYLGSLTQFTDDLRDYTVDLAIGNANLMAGLETAFGKNAHEKFKRWYSNEEEKMLEAFQNSGLDLDTGIMRAIPWYPSLIRS